MLRNLPATAIRVILGLLLTSCLALLVAPTSSLAASTTINIDDARASPLGRTVTVKGTVTVPSGAFASGSFDQGFAIQDKTGGIYVSIQTNLGLKIRDQVEVTGQLADSFGLLILVPAGPNDIKHKGHGRGVEPEEIDTGAISEATEGWLVAIEGTITQPIVNDLPYGYRIFVDDGSGVAQVFVYPSTGINVSSLQPGQKIKVIGFSAQFVDHYEINPRIPGDIQVQ